MEEKEANSKSLMVSGRSGGRVFQSLACISERTAHLFQACAPNA